MAANLEQTTGSLRLLILQILHTPLQFLHGRADFKHMNSLPILPSLKIFKIKPKKSRTKIVRLFWAKAFKDHYIT
jgi:hypothetical protein